MWPSIWRRRSLCTLKHHWWLSSDFIDESDEERQEEEDSHPLRTGGPHLEGDIPAHLNKMGVRNVPTVLCHGDKPGYCHTGHLEEDTSEVQHELVFEVRSAFRINALSPGRGAHDDAVNLDRVLHRDISCGNTLIYLVNYTTKLGITTYMWTGLLNDLGVSKPIAEPGAAYFACRAGRTGTWQFISARIWNTTAGTSDALLTSSSIVIRSTMANTPADNPSSRRWKADPSTPLAMGNSVSLKLLHTHIH
ncbi:hypothetical protein A0H81_06332 [Grifola frondosa]|uniref:Uncharacterized protein n=1 Tax=Grifola frondosa TaxID=5627 RepID=A0A1C7MGM0_GRIFR|nr:hypothetical protein A0H81_06332 [Grifola frondosa]